MMLHLGKKMCKIVAHTRLQVMDDVALRAIAAKEKVAKEFGSDVMEGRYNPCF